MPGRRRTDAEFLLIALASRRTGHSITAHFALASALPTPKQTEKVSISLPVVNWLVFYSFVIDHEIPFAYERPLCHERSYLKCKPLPM
jgi:hypothetical protein